jgi:DNA-binding transcriptional LysR family regulator
VGAALLNLQRVAAFVAVVQAKNFTAAAAALGQTKAVVSFHVRQLEAELGVALLLRTTRRLTPTEAGEVFYRRGVRLLKEAEEIVDEVRGEHQGLSGELHITSTSEYGAHVIVPALAAFRQLHPGLKIRHVSSSQHEDLISARFDLAIRLGSLADSSHRAALLARFRVLPVASPGWLQAHPVDSPRMLEQADWGIHDRLNDPLRWQLVGPGQTLHALEISKPAMFTSDSASALMAFALAGSGIALLPEWLVGPALKRGELCHLLPEYAFPQQGIYAVYPDTRHVPEKVRTFIDFLRQRMLGAQSLRQP